MKSFGTIGLAALISAAFIEGSTASNTTAYVTEVVTASTIVCPTTTLGPDSVYTVQEIATITISNCACTSTGLPSSTSTTILNSTATTYTPAVYTGAASQFDSYRGVVALCAAAIPFLL